MSAQLRIIDGTIVDDGTAQAARYAYDFELTQQTSGVASILSSIYATVDRMVGAEMPGPADVQDLVSYAIALQNRCAALVTVQRLERCRPPE